MRFTLLITALSATLLTGVLQAGDQGHAGGFGILCPNCEEPCYPTVTKGTETKTCWDVECKAICIPKVTFPWEARAPGKGEDCKDGCVQPKCGRTKYVNVLMEYEYECSACKYSFDISDQGNGKKSGETPVIAPSPDATLAPPAEASWRWLRLLQFPTSPAADTATQPALRRLAACPLAQ